MIKYKQVIFHNNINNKEEFIKFINILTDNIIIKKHFHTMTVGH
jgi:hypothetical protein